MDGCRGGRNGAARLPRRPSQRRRRDCPPPLRVGNTSSYNSDRLNIRIEPTTGAQARCPPNSRSRDEETPQRIESTTGAQARCPPSSRSRDAERRLPHAVAPAVAP